MAQRLCLITGGNTGIGYEVARQLLQRGHEVIIACRDAGRAERAVASLQQSTSSSTISSVQCDLSSFSSVRACAEHVSSKWPKLDVLVCNAAVITQQPTVTNDGYNTMYQVNHLSHFLLAHLLLPQLLKSGQGRLVVVGSQQHTRVPSEHADPEFFHKFTQELNPENPKPQQQQPPKTPVPTQMQLYSLTKLYNMWFVKHMTEQVLPQLQQQLQQQQQQQGVDGSSSNSSSLPPLVVNAVSPGFVPSTDLSRNLAGFIGRIGMKFIMPWAPFAVTVQEGASRVAALCDGDAEGQTNGAYYVKYHVSPVTGPAADAAKAAQLWQLSCKDTGVQQYLP